MALHLHESNLQLSLATKWRLLSCKCRANRPHLGLCPETTCSSPVATGISGLHSKFTQGVRPRLEWQQSTPLSSQVAMGISWSPLRGLKGVKPPVEFRERSRGCSLGPVGKEGPHLAMMGESHGFSQAAVPVWAFSSCMTWRTIPNSLSKLHRRLDNFYATQWAPRDTRRDSRRERSTLLPLEMRPDSPVES